MKKNTQHRHRFRTRHQAASVPTKRIQPLQQKDATAARILQTRAEIRVASIRGLAFV